MDEQAKTMRHWRWEKDGDNIVWLYADNGDASTNVLSSVVLDELNAALDQIQGHSPRGLVILSAKENGFIAGADVKEFVPLKDEHEARGLIERGQRVFDRIEALPFPVVAAIHGFCLGGGMELALACHYRIADDDPSTKLGLPEVKLGLHPGFGGTVRLPPLIGAPAAMDMILTGRSVSARAAKKMGLVNYAVPSRQMTFAARQTILKPPPRAKATGWKAWTNHGLVRPLLAAYLRRQTAQKAPQEHYPAPYAVIDMWDRYGGDPKALLAEEARSLARMVLNDTARNLIKLFFLQERIKGLGRKKGYAPTRVHVVGAGVMGGDIAAWCAMQGLTVTLQDRRHENIAKVIKRAAGLYHKILKEPRAVTAALDRLIPDIPGHGVGRADVIIEAIFEDVEAKHKLFREIEPKAKADALIATNTSSIPLQVLGKALKTPSRLVGLHFFNPVSKMQLVEIVSGPDTDAEVAQRAAAFAKHISRLPVPVKSAPGFLVNRVLMPYLMEAVILETEGVPASVIDDAALKFGMPMGPIHLADTVGLDICKSVADILSKSLGGEVPKRLEQLVSTGNLGVKSGRGFYNYKDGKPERSKPDAGYAPPADLTDRLMFRMFNECVACLREGIVEDADLLDGGVIFGTGFAPFRGGPINYIRAQGVAAMRSRLMQLEARYGQRFREDEGWASL